MKVEATLAVPVPVPDIKLVLDMNEAEARELVSALQDAARWSEVAVLIMNELWLKGIKK
jgi:hypothetical protein